MRRELRTGASSGSADIISLSLCPISNVPHAFSHPEGGPLAHVAQNGAWWMDVYIGLEEVWGSLHHPEDPQCSPSSPWYLHTLGKHLLQGWGSNWHPGTFTHWIQQRVCWNLGQNCLKGWVHAKAPPVLGRAAVGMFPSCSLST